MSSINLSAKEVTLKLVYYGPGRAGKTTCLQHIHTTLPERDRPKLVSIATEEDRTLFCDYLPIEKVKVGPYTVRMSLYTVPGQVVYQSTRKLLLNGADGVVFVADSDPVMREANIESLSDLETNLADWGHSLAEFPCVLQFNKRDLPGAMPVDLMSSELNSHCVPCFESIASRGANVEEALRALTRLVIDKVEKSYSGKRRDRSAPPPRSSAANAAARRQAEDFTSEIASAIEDSVVQSLDELGRSQPDEPPPGSRPLSLSFSDCWGDNFMRAETIAIEDLILRGQHGQAIIKAAQVVNYLALKAGHGSDQEAVFVLLRNVNPTAYRRFRALVSRALRNETLSDRDAFLALHFVLQFAFDDAGG
jgi:signal recognition particle receptor subunit beta